MHSEVCGGARTAVCKHGVPEKNYVAILLARWGKYNEVLGKWAASRYTSMFSLCGPPAAHV